MSHTHHAGANHNREGKRAQFARPNRQQKFKSTSVLLIVLTTLAGIAAYVVTGSSTNRPAATAVFPAQASTTSLSSGDISIPTADVSDGNAKFFDYRASDGRNERFFVIKSSDGVYRAALDACDVCFAGKKGYHQEGDAVVCNQCGKHFASALVNEVTGGCNPVGLPRAVEGDSLVIRASELENRRSFF